MLCKLRERKNYSAEVQQHNFMLYVYDLKIDKLLLFRNLLKKNSYKSFLK